MHLIVGLGNPGSKYESTPHNAGFLFLDLMREFLGWDALYAVDEWVADKSFESQISRARVGSDTKIMLVKPQTFMNSSGRAVRKLVEKFNVSVSSGLILVHDDLDIKLGEYKIQRAKGPKVHNGLKSVESLVGTTDFMRIRIGVDNRKGNSSIPGDQYVLQKMNDEELTLLKESCVEAVKSARSLLTL